MQNMHQDMHSNDGRSDSGHATQAWRGSTHGNPYGNDANNHIDITTACSSDYDDDGSMDMSGSNDMCQGFQIMNPQMYQMQMQLQLLQQTMQTNLMMMQQCMNPSICMPGMMPGMLMPGMVPGMMSPMFVMGHEISTNFHYGMQEKDNQGTQQCRGIQGSKSSRNAKGLNKDTQNTRSTHDHNQGISLSYMQPRHKVKVKNKKSHGQGRCNMDSLIDVTERYNKSYQGQSQEGPQGNHNQGGVQEPDPVILQCAQQDLGEQHCNHQQSHTVKYKGIHDEIQAATSLQFTKKDVFTNTGEVTSKVTSHHTPTLCYNNEAVNDNSEASSKDVTQPTDDDPYCGGKNTDPDRNASISGGPAPQITVDLGHTVKSTIQGDILMKSPVDSGVATDPNTCITMPIEDGHVEPGTYTASEDQPSTNSQIMLLLESSPQYNYSQEEITPDFGSQPIVSSVSSYSDMYQALAERKTTTPTLTALILMGERHGVQPYRQNGQEPFPHYSCQWLWRDGVPWDNAHQNSGYEIEKHLRTETNIFNNGETTLPGTCTNPTWLWRDGVPWKCSQCLEVESDTEFKMAKKCSSETMIPEPDESCRLCFMYMFISTPIRESLHSTNHISLVVETKYKPPGTELNQRGGTGAKGYHGGVHMTRPVLITRMTNQLSSVLVV